MIRYVVRRLLHAVLLLFAVSAGVFLLADLAPGDYFAALRADPRIDPEMLDALRSQYGLDRPLPERYAAWLSSMAQGEMGLSLSYNMPVSALLAPRIGNTLRLAALAWLLTWSTSVPLGFAGAIRPGGWLDSLGKGLSSTLLIVPDLLLASILLLVAVRSGLFRIGGLALALMALAPGAAPIVLRHTRAAVRDVIEAPYILAARARGIRPLRLWLVYVLPAAANPLISLLGLSFGGLLSGSLIVEAVIGWPGLGPLFLEAISARDFYVVIGVAMCSAGFLVGGNFLADILLCVSDPRIRRSV